MSYYTFFCVVSLLVAPFASLLVNLFFGLLVDLSACLCLLVRRFAILLFIVGHSVGWSLGRSVD